MKRRSNPGESSARMPKSGQELSPGLARLDRDLREIAIEERSSFAPELRAELASEYAQIEPAGRSGERWGRVGLRVAAAVALLLVGTWLVPPARASLVRWLRPLPEVAPASVDPLPEPSPPAVVVDVPDSPAPDDLRAEPERTLPAAQADDEPNDSLLRLPPTLPSLADREHARRIVTDEYPVDLQEGGIGGVVRVLLWVGLDGVADSPTVRVSSGVPALDEAALRATRSFRFLPATRAGQKVGTWVEFSVRFEPDPGESQPDLEYQAFEIPLGNW